LLVHAEALEALASPGGSSGICPVAHGASGADLTDARYAEDLSGRGTPLTMKSNVASCSGSNTVPVQVTVASFG
jgi:hypothetical protein